MVEINPADIREIRDLFLRQAAAETAHDLDAVAAVLAQAEPDQPDPVTFVARAYRFWGRQAVIDHFRAAFEGTWRFEPDEQEIRIIPLGQDAAQIYAPTKITFGAPGDVGTAVMFHVNEIAIRTREGWRISAIVPVPAA